MEVARQTRDEPFNFAGKRPLELEPDEPRSDARSEKANLRRLAIVNERRQYEETRRVDEDTSDTAQETTLSQEPAQPEIDPDSGLHVPTLRATSVIPSLSLMYADTAPRDVWRPQIETWMKKSGHRIRDVERAVEASDKLDEKYTLRDPPPAAAPKPHKPKNTASAASAAAAAAAAAAASAVSDDAEVMLKPPSPAKSSPHKSSPVQAPVPPPPHMASPHPSPHLETTLVASPALSPPKPVVQTTYTPSYGKRRCISCGSDQSPCWRPSWSASAGQLCNSCGLRYKKTGARCTESDCGRIPAKGEWAVMRNTAKRNPDSGRMEYACIYCRGVVEVNERF